MRSKHRYSDSRQNVSGAHCYHKRDHAREHNWTNLRWRGRDRNDEAASRDSEHGRDIPSEFGCERWHRGYPWNWASCQCRVLMIVDKALRIAREAGGLTMPHVNIKTPRAHNM